MTRNRKPKRGPSTEGQDIDSPRKRRLLDEKASSDEVIELQEGQEILISGQANLCVKAGAIIANGFKAKQQTSIVIAADAEIGGPLLVQAVREKEETTIPLAVETATSLHFTSIPNAEDRPLTAGKSYTLHPKAAANAFQPLTIPHSWQQAVTRIADGLKTSCGGIVTVAGTRGIGKSSFARLLVNHLLNDFPSVAFLETDLGQPEFTVPGLLSLHFLTDPIFGPPHLHQRRPDFTQFIGDVSPQSEIQQCSAAVHRLYESYRMHCSHQDSGITNQSPLVVNTHGWIQGIGLQFLTNVLSIVAPTHVVMLQSKSARRNLSCQQFWQVSELQQPCVITTVPGIGVQGTASAGEPSPPDVSGVLPGLKPKILPAIETRGLAWLAFARRCCGKSPPECSWDTAAFSAAAHSLAMQRPYAVDFSYIRVKTTQSSLAEEQWGAALNCSIVGLSNNDSDLMGSEATYETPLACFGVGLVRAVDTQKNLLYILTDLPPHLLENVNLLQVGRLSLPPLLLQTAAIASPYLSFGSLGSGGSGSAVIKSRNTLVRSSNTT